MDLGVKRSITKPQVPNTTTLFQCFGIDSDKMIIIYIFKTFQNID